MFLANTSGQKFFCRHGRGRGAGIHVPQGDSRELLFKLNFTLGHRRPSSRMSSMEFAHLLCQTYEPLSRSASATVSLSQVCGHTWDLNWVLGQLPGRRVATWAGISGCHTLCILFSRRVKTGPKQVLVEYTPILKVIFFIAQVLVAHLVYHRGGRLQPSTWVSRSTLTPPGVPAPRGGWVWVPPRSASPSRAAPSHLHLLSPS